MVQQLGRAHGYQAFCRYDNRIVYGRIYRQADEANVDEVGIQLFQYVCVVSLMEVEGDERVYIVEGLDDFRQQQPSWS